jgi:hypothetical protein
LAAQASFDLSHEAFRKPQGIEGLLEGLSGVLRSAAVSREALVRFEAVMCSGFGVLFGVSFAGGHVNSFALYRAFAVEVCTRVTRSQHFPLSFVNHVRYKRVLTASAMPTPSSARLTGRGRVGDDL